MGDNTMSTTERLAQLNTEIADLESAIASQRHAYEELVATGNDEKADRKAASINKQEARLAVLQARAETLVVLVEREAGNAIAEATNAATAVADAAYSDVVEQYKVLDVQAAELTANIEALMAQMSAQMVLYREAYSQGGEPVYGMLSDHDTGGLSGMGGTSNRLSSSIHNFWFNAYNATLPVPTYNGRA